MKIPEESKISNNILLNFIFFKEFSRFYDLEKFVLFFSFDSLNKEIENIIKEEIMKNINYS